jgi:hypothetical protein
MLRFARVTLACVNIANWAIGLGLIAFLIVTGFVVPDRVVDRVTALHPELVGGNVILMLRLGVVFCPLMIWLVHRIITSLVAIIDSIPSGDVFTPTSAARLQRIAVAMLAVCVIDLVFGVAAVSLIGPYSMWSPAISLWLTSLLLFILARVFREGAVMRADLEGTV